MAGRYWKEASSVITVARSPFSLQNGVKLSENTSQNNAGNLGKLNEESIDSGKKVRQYNYKVLTLKRSSKSRFLPNACSFPGGQIERADASLDWLELFRTFGIAEDSFSDLICSDECFPPIFISDSNKSELMRSLSLRIAAVRETFEECGLLICRNSLVNKQTTNTLWASYLAGHNLKQWQKAVHTNPTKFLEMCKHIQCYPDVWALKVWSNWLTPSDMGPKRYDTAFFIATLDQIPPVYADDLEATELEWRTPSDYIQRFQDKKLWFAPPQYYEISRLLNFSDITQLAEFASSRNNKGCDLWMPVHVQADDGKVSLLPGDSLYPEKPDYYGEKSNPDLNMTLKKAREKSDKLHRVELYSLHDVKVVSNIKPSKEHVQPIEVNSTCNL